MPAISRMRDGVTARLHRGRAVAPTHAGLPDQDSKKAETPQGQLGQRGEERRGEGTINELLFQR